MGQSFIWRDEMNQYVILSYAIAGFSFLVLTLAILKQKRRLFQRLKDIDVE